MIAALISAAGTVLGCATAVCLAALLALVVAAACGEAAQIRHDAVAEWGN